MKFISVIVPAYNAQKTIHKCISSLVNADYDKKSYEIIVVDNNSTDKTAEIIKSFPEVTYVKETTQGRSYARNTGARIAKGELLAFIDSDVFIEAGWLKHLSAGFSKDYVGGGQGRIIPCDQDGQLSLNRFRIRQQTESTSGTNIILRLMYIESPMVNSAACMYRKEAFHFVGGFDVLLERHEDIDLSKRVSLAGYDLTAQTQAVAHVEYHGEGWGSYFMRSLSEGYTKQSYNKKWQQYFTTLNHNEAPEGPVKKPLIPDSIRLNYYLVKDEIVFNVIRSLIKWDSYYFLKAINSTFKATGRALGILKNDYRGRFEPRYQQNVLNKSIVFQNNQKINLDTNLRFINQDNEILYVMNIEKNDFLKFNNFKALNGILDQRTIQ
nr:glycosyltransferase [Bacteriovorax sp. HI3]